ncbi:MAG: hypothetical protein LBU73_05070 [Helicobacteraceae bacterium]|jgi:hypothetical protein|nr:hypothetical protein [Helicobacteraceae bacterium]
MNLRSLIKFFLLIKFWHPSSGDFSFSSGTGAGSAMKDIWKATERAIRETTKALEPLAKTLSGYDLARKTWGELNRANEKSGLKKHYENFINSDFYDDYISSAVDYITRYGAMAIPIAQIAAIASALDHINGNKHFSEMLDGVEPELQAFSKVAIAALIAIATGMTGVPLLITVGAAAIEAAYSLDKFYDQQRAAAEAEKYNKAYADQMRERARLIEARYRWEEQTDYEIAEMMTMQYIRAFPANDRYSFRLAGEERASVLDPDTPITRIGFERANVDGDVENIRAPYANMAGSDGYENTIMPLKFTID